MPKAEFLAFDTETTGLNEEVNEIISISMLVLDESLNTVSGVTFFAHPSEGAVIDEGALKVNGYTKEKWDSLGAVTQEEMFNGVYAFLKGYSRLKQIAHNLPFDRGFLKALFNKHWKKEKHSKGYDSIFGYHGLDTVGVAIFTDLVTLGAMRPAYRLQVLSEAYGVTHTEAHTSLSDVLAMVDILKKMRDTLKGQIVVDANAVKEALEKPKSFSKIITKVDSENNIWKFTAGKHSGRFVAEVLSIEPDYLEFCLRMDNLSEEQRKYLEAIYNGYTNDTQPQ
jgi:DNA polymerase III epsilon subunit-like protein